MTYIRNEINSDWSNSHIYALYHAYLCEDNILNNAVRRAYKELNLDHVRRGFRR